MNKAQYSDVIRRIEELDYRGRRSADCHRSMQWFLDFIDQVESSDEVNAYAEALDEHHIALCS